MNTPATMLLEDFKIDDAEDEDEIDIDNCTQNELVFKAESFLSNKMKKFSFKSMSFIRENYFNMSIASINKMPSKLSLSPQITLQEALLKGRTLMIISMMMIVFCNYFNLVFGAIVTNTYKYLGTVNNLSVPMLESLSVFYFLVSSLSRLSWGIFYDMYKFKKCYTVIIIVQLVVSMTLYASSHHEGWFFVNVLLTAAIFGAPFSLFTPLCGYVYGVKLAAKVYGVMFLGNGCAAISGPILALFVLGDNVATYNTVYIIGSFLAIIGILILINFKEEKIEKD